MKYKIINGGVIVLIALFITALIIFIPKWHSDQDSLKLLNVTTKIGTYESVSGSTVITHGKKKGETIVPTVLFYTFTIKNTGPTNVGGTRNEKLHIHISPDPELIKASKEALGVNIFNSYKLGGGYSFGEVPAGKKEKWTVSFTLGAKEKNPEIPLLPNKEKLKGLKEKALNATLIVKERDKIIARLDLKK